jgi:phosphatidylinositol-3-phosphatase
MRKLGVAMAGLLVSAAVVGCGGHGASGKAESGSATPGATTSNPASGAPVTDTSPAKINHLAKIDHVVWIFMENRGYGDIIGSSQAPYINRLGTRYGLATNYYAVSHPSLPNYIAATSGATQGITDDNGPSSDAVKVPSIFSQLPGGRARSLEESMPANCSKSNSGEYAVRHNPEAYFANLGSDCSNYDVPFGSVPDLSASFTFVTPNVIDDMHDGTISDGDTFLKRYVPALLATPQYRSGKTVIFITWDEDAGPCSGCTNKVPLIVISPYTHYVQDGTSFSLYSLLRTTEELLGLPLLSKAASANSMVGKFGF